MLRSTEITPKKNNRITYSYTADTNELTKPQTVADILVSDIFAVSMESAPLVTNTVPSPNSQISALRVKPGGFGVGAGVPGKTAKFIALPTLLQRSITLSIRGFTPSAVEIGKSKGDVFS